MPPRIDFKSQRIFVDHDLSEGLTCPLSDQHAHYLLTVLRMETGAQLLVFNGRDGEWRASVERASKRAGHLKVLDQTRAQTPHNDLTLLFAPIKKDRLGWMVEKAVEMGAGRIGQVLTDHTQGKGLKLDKLVAHSIEAAEQCGVLAVPDSLDTHDLNYWLQNLASHENQAQSLIFCDEHSALQNPFEALSGVEGQSLTILIGPEGGFSQSERDTLLSKPFVTPIGLGPRILRADTAVVAALTAVQLAVGDWR